MASLLTATDESVEAKYVRLDLQILRDDESPRSLQTSGNSMSPPVTVQKPVHGERLVDSPVQLNGCKQVLLLESIDSIRNRRTPRIHPKSLSSPKCWRMRIQTYHIMEHSCTRKIGKIA